MKRRRTRVAAIGAATLIAALTVTSVALAHANMSPPVAKVGVLQYFTLAVPTEKSNATTTQIQLTVPSGFAIDSYEPSPRWTRSVKGHTVTWAGGSVPTEEDAVFHFAATLTGGSKTYTFGVRQTYSDGSVVEWNGPETSDTPSPTIEGVSSFGGGSSSTLAIAALIVGGVAIILSIVALASGRRSLT
jgi:uncharacterized protein YcnI